MLGQNMVGMGEKILSLVNVNAITVHRDIMSAPTSYLMLNIFRLCNFTNLYFFKKFFGATQCTLVLQKKGQSGSICSS